TFDGLEPSDSISDYIYDKLGKHEAFLEGSTGIDVIFKAQVHAKGVSNDYIVAVNVAFPRKVVRVEESADEMYKAIDAAEDALIRRIKRYLARRDKKITRPWKELPE